MERLTQLLREQIEEYAARHRLTDSKKRALAEKVTEIYQKSQYDSEEPVGIIAAQSLSEPATQMSIDSDEKVVIKQNGAIRIVKIGEFIDGFIRSSGRREGDGWEVADTSAEDIQVPSITWDEKIRWSPVTLLSRHKSPGELVEIGTLSGRKITATDSHSFVTRKGNRIVSVAGCDLRPGDRIPSVKHLPENCIQQIETAGILGSQRNAKRRMPSVLDLTRELGWVFGAYLAEGNCTPNFVSFSNTDPAFLSRVREFAANLGFTFNEYDNERGFAPSHDIRINSRQLSILLEKTCGTGSSNKIVPEFAYSASPEFVSGLLSGYFDGDGSVSVERRMIRASSRSGELADGIALLLSRLGIFTTKSSSEKEGTTLCIPGKYARPFMENIGLNVKGKKERLGKLCLIHDNSRDEIDMIGGFGNLLLDVSRKLGMPSRHVNSFTKRQRIGRSALSRHVEEFERRAAEQGVDINKELSILSRMRDSDVVWDEITSMKQVKPSSGHVYDFTVEGTQTFTTFDGIVTHNTMRTYHFAGTAGIQVTLGLPRLLEIFDARKEPKTPTMTIFLKEDCQSLDKAKQIAELIREVKAKDAILSTTVDLTELWIKCQLNFSKLAELGIPREKANKLIKMRNAETVLEGDTLIVKPKIADLKTIHKFKYSVLESHIKGIKGISQVVVTKEGNEWIITTLGSNLAKVFEIEGVDYTRTYSNNIFEIYEVLGVEAARNAIIGQSKYTIEEQGLGIDVRYIMLLADLMTASGEIKAIGRYGIAGQKASVLVRASFEETKKHLIGASVRGEKDALKGTIENIMMNQVAPIGTGSYDLIGRMPTGFIVTKAAPAKKAAKPTAKPKPATKKPAKKLEKKTTSKKPANKPAKKAAAKKK